MRNNSTFHLLLITGFLLVFVFSCKKDAPKTAPTITIVSTTNITDISATCGGEISSDGGSSILARGVCWSINQNPTISDSKTTDGVGTSSFSSSITGLAPGTPYFIKAYATNSVGTSYSSQLTFSTIAVVPVLTTNEVTAITSTTATCGGNVNKDGGSTVKARGLCWSTHQNPTIQDSITIDGLGLGTFTSSILRLTPGTVYYFRAYAINNIGTGYGNQVTATATAVLPAITTTSVLAVTSTTVSIGGVITYDGGALISARGVCWSTSQNPTLADSKTTDGTGPSSFTSSITGLTPGMTYYIRAYATNSIGTVYGGQVSTTTTAILPTLTTTAFSAVTPTTATGGGNVTNDGGASVSVRGVCWSTSTNPTIADNKTDNGTGTGSFTSAITGLKSGTTYYFKAYATNSIGTAYGNQVTTMTIPIPLIVFTTPASAITATTATSGGNIIDGGSSNITSRGVCWSTSQNPTLADNKTNDGTGAGSFTSSITGLTPGTTYYIRAFGTNSNGTLYAPQVSFTSTAL